MERQAFAQGQADAVLLEQIFQVHVVSDAGHNRIASVMRTDGLRDLSRRRGWCVTTQRDKKHRPATDLVQIAFTATAELTSTAK